MRTLVTFIVSVAIATVTLGLSYPISVIFPMQVGLLISLISGAAGFMLIFAWVDHRSDRY